ncbi:MAG: right-handed parallel beta-helix repeat-containing protein [Chloroflexi bacterium]|nr:right-handed parallel beta-helix repeat-containing protein [Chloroflexota bacterium]
MERRNPIAFLSYVDLDDHLDGGRLRLFRERLAREVSMHTRQELTILQDRKDSLWVQTWKDRVEDHADDVTFLIPILTPRFFVDPDCRSELRQFFDRERELKRDDLVLPVYYVTCPLLEDPDKWKRDDLAAGLKEHRRPVDWREVRFEPFTSPLIGQKLEELAIQIGDSLNRPQVAIHPRPNPIGRALGLDRFLRKNRASTSTPEPDTEIETDAIESGSIETAANNGVPEPAAAAGPRTRIVDPMGRSDHFTIGEAIEKAESGDRILVRPGLYQEAMVINKPVEIIGDGNLEDIVVQASGANVLLFDTTMGRVANLTLRQLEGKDSFCVNVTRGRLFLEDCDITSHSLACIAIYGGADPRINRNRIHGGKQSGVMIYDKALGTLEDNDIYGNAFSGVEIKGDGNPALRRNRIYDNRESGVYIYDGGQGLLEDNDIFRNHRAGVRLGNSVNPSLRRNRINRNGIVAVWAPLKGGGDIEDNDLRNNAYGAWNVSNDSDEQLKRSANLE